MTTHDTEALLARMFEADKDAADYYDLLPNLYALNQALGLRPWYPAAVEVWRNPEPPEELRQDQVEQWQEVRAMLDHLHAEYVTVRCPRPKPRRGRRD